MLRCNKCGQIIDRINIGYHRANCPGKDEMGHAFKLMVLMKGPNGYTSHEVLHYINQDAAEDSFAALEALTDKEWKISVLKLYEPPKRYSRG